MKKYIVLFTIFCGLLFSICAENITKIDDSLFDTLQRPLAHQLQASAKPISRKSWEYHMAGIGWWDIYVLTGRKIGNGMYDIFTNESKNVTVRELHGTSGVNDTLVNSVELIFTSSDRLALQTIRNDFEKIATSWYGKGNVGNDYTNNWSSGVIYYTAYPIQHHEDGNYIFIISSLDTAHSGY